MRKILLLIFFGIFLIGVFHIIQVSASVTSVVTYNFTDTTNNKAYNYTHGNDITTTAQRLANTSFVELLAVGYTNIQTINAVNTTTRSAATNDWISFRFTFILNQSASIINQLNITFRGAERADDANVEVIVYNWTGDTWTNVSTALGAALATKTLNLTGVNISHVLGDLNDNITIIVDNPTGLADSGENISVDYIEVKVRYTDNNPNWSDNSTNSTLAGSTVLHSVFWTDDVGFSGYIFSFDNGTGTFSNNTWAAMDSSNWTNVSKVVNFTEGTTIRWRVYANDSSNNLNVTSNFQYTTTAVTDSCTCTDGASWTIIDGDQCVLSTTCNLGANRFRVMNGALKITSTGFLNAQGCYIQNAESLFVIGGGKLICR